MIATKLRGIDRGLAAAWILALLYAILFSALSLMRHAAFNTHAYDLGLQHQVTWNTFHGHWFQYTYMVGFNPNLTNHLGDHVQPILLPISWLYIFHDGPETLLVLQAFLIGMGAVPLFLLARRKLHHATPALIFAGVYLLNPAVQAANLFDFHPESLAVAFLLWAFYFAEIEAYAGLAVTVLVLLLTKENLSLAVALLGLYLLVWRRRVKPGLVLIAAGATWFLLCFFVVLPALNPGKGSNAFTRYQYLGSDWTQVLLTLITKPGIWWQRLRDPLTLHYLAGLFVPLGGLSWLSPGALMVGASELVLNVLSSFYAQRTIDYQYSSVVVAAGAAAAVYGSAWLARQAERRGRVPWRVGVNALALWALAATLIFHFNHYGTLRPWGPEYRDSYQVTAHDRAAQRFVAEIPTTASVSAQSDLAPHVSQRPLVYVFPTVNYADYVFLDTKSTIFPVQLFPIGKLTPEQAYEEYVRRLVTGGAYHVVDAADGWLLLRRGPAAAAAPALDLPAFLAGQS